MVSGPRNDHPARSEPSCWSIMPSSISASGSRRSAKPRGFVLDSLRNIIHLQGSAHRRTLLPPTFGPLGRLRIEARLCWIERPVSHVAEIHLPNHRICFAESRKHGYGAKPEQKGQGDAPPCRQSEGQ